MTPKKKRRCVEMQDDDGAWWLVCDDGTRVRLAFGARDGPPSLTLSIRMEQAKKDDDKDASG
ncbi:MAG TPA: hypothetical protein VFK80_02850 [Limnochordia bacterium]|nr:hypothetical protein [Limnochordia bacterium]